MATLFILHGHWETMEERGMTIVKASYSEDEVIRILNGIVENGASKYCKIEGDFVTEDYRATMYERTDSVNNEFLGFYITPHQVEIPDTLEQESYEKVKKQYLSCEIKKMMAHLLGNGTLTTPQYDSAVNNEAVIDSIAEQYEKNWDRDLPFSEQLVEAIKSVLNCVDK